MAILVIEDFSTEELFQIPNRAGVVKCLLTDLASELNLTCNCDQSEDVPRRVCAKCWSVL